MKEISKTFSTELLSLKQNISFKENRNRMGKFSPSERTQNFTILSYLICSVVPKFIKL